MLVGRNGFWKLAGGARERVWGRPGDRNEGRGVWGGREREEQRARGRRGAWGVRERKAKGVGVALDAAAYGLESRWGMSGWRLTGIGRVCLRRCVDGALMFPH